VEFQRLRGGVADPSELAERLEDGDRAGAIVVRTGRTLLRLAVVLGVLVGAEDDDAVVRGDVRAMNTSDLALWSAGGGHDPEGTHNRALTERLVLKLEDGDERSVEAVLFRDLEDSSDQE
jgi:hypothetical protein